MKKWKTLKEEDVSPSKWFPVSRQTVELPDGKIFNDYYIAKLSDVVMVLPVLKDGRFILVKQYKHGLGEIVIEFPAGYQEPGDSLEYSAIKELEEEVGIKSQESNLISLGRTAPSPGKFRQRVYLYLLKDLEFNSQQKFDSTEDIELLIVEPKEVLEMVKDGRIYAADTLSCVTQAHLKHPELFK